MVIRIGGIPVEVIQKQIKNLHLSVLPPDGKVRVAAPATMGKESIELFVRSRLGWIRKQQEVFADQPRQSKRQYVSGETLYLWGRQYYLRVQYSYKGNSLVLAGDEAILTVRKESTAKQRGNFINQWYRELLKVEVEKLFPKWTAKTGLSASDWQIWYMTTRWGTCNHVTGRIRLNLQLAKKPIECLEYVILHELAHLKVRNHGAEFVAILDRYMPYWRDCQKLLNDSTLDYMPGK